MMAIRRASGQVRHHTLFGVERFRGYTLLDVRPQTGRSHQIRVHVQAIGHPLAIDPLYGSSEPLLLSALKPSYRPKAGTVEHPLMTRLTLHAQALELMHPTRGESAPGWRPFPRTSPPYCGTYVATVSYQGNHRRHHERRGGKRRVWSVERVRLTWPIRIWRRCSVSRSPVKCLSRSWMSAWVWCNSSGFHAGSSIPSSSFSGACGSLRRRICRSLDLPLEKAFIATSYPLPPAG